MKTALILGAAAVGAYLLIKHMQGASTPIGSTAPSPPPVAPGIDPGRTAASTIPGSTMRSYAAANTNVGNMVALGGLLRVTLTQSPRPAALAPSSFTPSSPGVSINNVTPPQASKVGAITQPNPPMMINRPNGLVRVGAPAAPRSLV